MLHVVNAGNRRLYTNEIEQWHQLRYAVYVKELNWKEVARDDGRECDQFDTDKTTHLLYVCPSTKKVVAGARINSTLGPTLTTEVFPHLCNRQPAPKGPTVADWTRFCVARERRDGTGLCREAREIYCGVMEYALSEGLTQLTFVAHTYWLQRFASVGFRLRILGTPQRCDGQPTVAGVIDVNEETLVRAREILNLDNDVLFRKGRQTPLRDVYTDPEQSNGEDYA